MPFTAVLKSMAKVSVNLDYCGIRSFNNVYGSVHDRIRIFSVRILPRKNNLWKTDNGLQVELINVSATDQVFKKGEDMACFQMLPDQSFHSKLVRLTLRLMSYIPKSQLMIFRHYFL